ncbi:MAG: hypothetical protein CMK02_12695 [Polycyclovorans sp.]|nr:hypothetical protein [Polycyclovorans sp.]|tara:strand:- start:74953 stop:76167 length:1215 start_codon:yes stop_codon:yes gene_type:complete
MTGWGIPAVCAAACLAFAATGRVAAAEAPASSGLIITRQALHAERLAAGEATRGPLATDVAIQSQDRLLTLSGGRVDLAISRHGFIALGDDTDLRVERVPFSTFDVDLRTQLRVARGHLRLVWKYPDFGARWPMVIDAGPFRISVTSGEYFVEHRDQRTLLCVAEGEAAISTPGQAEAAVFTASACYRLISGAPAQVAAVAPEGFVAARAARALLPLAMQIGLAWAETPSVTATAAMTPDAPGAPDPSAAPTPAPPRSLAEARDQALREAVGPAGRPDATPATPRPSPPSPPSPSPSPRAAAPARPTPTAVAEAAAAPSPASVPRGRWALNVASLNRRDAAVEVRQRLLGAGFSPEIVEASVDGRRWFRVQFRGLADAAAARALARRLEQEAGISGAWVIPPGR